MQTFLPFPDFAASARALDNRRLGKQRVEVYQILRALRGVTKGWQNHPATKMWRGYDNALAAYGSAMSVEWSARGFKDTLILRYWMYATPEGTGALADSFVVTLPSWFGNAALHRSHQSNLLRKDPAHYGPKFPGVTADLPYVWPV
jgi:hypothetical protein